jgi:acetyl esterase/lipase
MKQLIFKITSLLILFQLNGFAQERWKLWPNGFPEELYKNQTDTQFVAFFPSSYAIGKAPVILVIPGGGYRNVSFEKEGVDVVRWVNGLGYHALVLKYRLGPAFNHPAQINDAQRAIQIIREKAAEKNFDTSKIGVIGFSAGGHLAGMLSNSPNPSFSESQKINPVFASSKISFAILVYPVVTLTSKFHHSGSRIHLLGKQADDSVLTKKLSTHNMVNIGTPPTLLVHSIDDKAVPLENTYLYINAMREQKRNVEAVILPKGGHGYGLGQKVPECRYWTDYAEKWLERTLK